MNFIFWKNSHAIWIFFHLIIEQNKNVSFYKILHSIQWNFVKNNLFMQKKEEKGGMAQLGVNQYSDQKSPKTDPNKSLSSLIN